MGGLGVKVQHFPLTLLVVLTTLTLPCERDTKILFNISVQNRSVQLKYGYYWRNVRLRVEWSEIVIGLILSVCVG